MVFKQSLNNSEVHLLEQIGNMITENPFHTYGLFVLKSWL